MLSRRAFASGLAVAGVARAFQPPPGGVFNVKEFSAAGNGRALDTDHIQTCVDAAGRSGGGVVHFPPGKYLTGTIRLRERVTLRLVNGATLVGSTDLRHYPAFVPKLRSYTDNYTDKSLIYAESLASVGIEGDGTIDGQGAVFRGPYKVRPYLMRFVECRDVRIRDVELRDSPMWVQHYLACDGVSISGIRVHSRVNRNNDGIDIDSSANVRISDCHIVSGDDAIVLKATTGRPCRDVVVANCVVSSLCNGLKLGTESNGGFEGIAISNCSVYDTMLSGIALEEVDGGALERVAISNITMSNVKNPIFMRLGDRGRPFVEGAPRPATGAFRDVRIEGILASGASHIGCAIAGLPGHFIQNLTLRDIAIQSAAAPEPRNQPERAIPEEAEAYPEHKMFGVLPAYGFYLRHAEQVHMENIRLTPAPGDSRPALFCDDVRHAYFASVAASGRLLAVRGARTEDVVVAFQDAESVSVGKEVPARAVIILRQR